MPWSLKSSICKGSKLGSFHSSGGGFLVTRFGGTLHCVGLTRSILLEVRLEGINNNNYIFVLFNIQYSPYPGLCRRNPIEFRYKKPPKRAT